jgi:hypothetical protein
MIRVVIENILLFLAPAVLYFTYVLLTRRASSAGEVVNDAPLLWLFAAGAALMIGTLVFYGSTSGGRPDQVYIPPHMGKDGHIEPGQIK